MTQDGTAEVTGTIEREELVSRLHDVFSERGGAAVALQEILSQVRPEDIADALAPLTPVQQVAVFRAISEDAREVVVEEADPVATKQLLANLNTEEIVRLVDEMSPDDAADVVLQLPDQMRRSILSQVETIDPEQAEDIRELLEYPPQSAGGLMTPDYVRISEEATAGSAIGAIQGAIDAETINTIFVTNLKEQVVGVVSVRQLLTNKAQTPVTDFMEREVIKAYVTDDQSQAALLLERYNLSVLPIVDANEVMRGIITVDDVIDAIREEFDEDLFLLAGTAQTEYVKESINAKTRKRVPWLLVTLALGLVLAFLMSLWETLLSEHAKIAFFLPVLAGLAGNASIQASTLMVRSLSDQSLETSYILRTVFTELQVGFRIGLLCGLLISLGAMVIGSVSFGLMVGISMLIAITNATVLGTLVPMILHRAGFDPALSSGPFITTMNDVLSMIIYLTLASFVMEL